MGLRKEGTDIYAEMLRTDGAYTASQFVNAGEALIEAKSWDLANQAFEKAKHKAGTNSQYVVARAHIGQAMALFKRKAYAEACDSLDQFLEDPKMSRMSIAVDAHRLMIDVASEQGKTEKDAGLRAKHFGKAITSVKKLRNYWKEKPQWEQDTINLMSAEIKLRKMAAEEAMGLKDEAIETGKDAASGLLSFLQTRRPNEEHPFDKMVPGEVANLERCFAMMIPIYSKLGAEFAEDVMKYGQEYMELFPNGKARTDIQNCMNQAKTEGAKETVAEAPAATAEAPAEEASDEDAAAEEAPAEAESAPAAEEPEAPAAQAPAEAAEASAEEASAE